MHNYIYDKMVKVKDDAGKYASTYIRISKVMNDADQHFCIVEFSLALRKPRKIYGVDPLQAESLAIDFLKEIIKDYFIIDENGNNIEIP